MPCGLVVGLAERVDDLEPLERADLALALAGGDGLAEVVDLGLDVEVSSRFWIAVAPMWPSKYLPNQFFISR
jgi:hypothetical protein